jgi:hypothetical protein
VPFTRATDIDGQSWSVIVVIWGTRTTVAGDANGPTDGGRHVPVRTPLSQIFEAGRRDAATCATPFRRVVTVDE